MTREEIFNVWAPPDCDWSAWVKPVLFSYVGSEASISLPIVSTEWVPVSDGHTALVLDLPEARSVFYAIDLARRGFRPVPLYNAHPGPIVEPTAGQPNTVKSVCDVHSIVAAIEVATPILQTITLSEGAAPAFLLDAWRREGRGQAPDPDTFDNRSVSLPSDFPSASKLMARGIQRVLLVQERSFEPQTDLAHILFRWQQAGLSIHAIAVEKSSHSQSLRVRRPSIFKLIGLRLLVMLGLKRNPLGGFGGVHDGPYAG